MAARVNGQVKWHGIGVSEWRVLAALTRRDGIAMSELADRVLFKQPTLTKAVDRMERAGLVERRTSERDRRRTIVRVTERGRTLAAPLIVRARESEAAMLAELGTAALGDLADRLRTLIERLSPKPGRNRATRRPRAPRESETRV